jgi:hypothetical protein
MAPSGRLLEAVVAIPHSLAVPDVCGADSRSVAIRADYAATADGLAEPMNITRGNGLGVLGDWGY